MPKSVFLFDEFRLDPARRELFKGSVLIDLPSTSLDGLIYLVQHRDRAVGRDELISAIWGRADISDNLLSQTLVRVRRALDDIPPRRGYIRTMTRFGYRWVAPTRVETTDSQTAVKTAAAPNPAPAASVPPAEPSHPEASTAQPNDAKPDTVAESVRTDASADNVSTAPSALPPPASAPRAPSRRRLAITVSIATLAMATLGTIAFLAGRSKDASQRHAPPESEINSSALVLPVEVHASSDWEWLRFGIMDLIANRLRAGGIPTLDSANVYKLVAARPELEHVSPQTDIQVPGLGGHRIYPSASLLPGSRWQVQLLSVRGAQRLTAQAEAADITEAARTATDSLLIMLGRLPPTAGRVDSPSVEQLLQSTQAALLVGRPADAELLIGRAPQSVQDEPSVQIRLAEIEIQTGKLASAHERMQQLPARLKETDSLLRARALITGAWAAVLGPNPEQATDALDQGLQIAETVNSVKDIASALEALALKEQTAGRAEQSLVDLGKARLLYQTVGDPLRVAKIDLRAGAESANIGRFTDAVAYLSHAEKTFANFGVRDLLAFARASHVLVNLALLENESALEMSAEFWPPESVSSNDRTLYFLILTRAFALEHSGFLAQADELFERIESQATGVQQTRVRRKARLGRGEVAVARGAYAKALEHLGPLLADTISDEDDIAVHSLAWHLKVKALRQDGKLTEAIAETERFAAWAASLASASEHALSGSKQVQRDARFFSDLDIATNQAAQHQFDRSLPAFAALLTQAKEQQIPERIVEVASAYIDGLIASGRLDEASSVGGIVSMWSDSDMSAAWTQARAYRALGEYRAYRAALERTHKLAGERLLPGLADGT